MLKYSVLLMFMLFFTSATLAQEDTVDGIRVSEWNEFQATQEQIVEKQGTILGRIGDVDQRIRQINLNLLSWQDATVAAGAGDNRGCDLLKTKYDPRLEWTVVALALLGIYLFLNKVASIFKKKSPPVTIEGV
jgi:hypothetical protein